MNDVHPLLALWHTLETERVAWALATIVAVEGSGYRKPGAMMLIAADGRRAGTISGGCLEAEVAQKALWHTRSGPVVRSYSTRAEDGDVPFGMGCGGVVHVLLEPPTTAQNFLATLAACNATRTTLAQAIVLSGPAIAERALATDDAQDVSAQPLAALAIGGLRGQTGAVTTADGTSVRVLCHPARTGLHILGAGDDAQPLVLIAKTLGWYVTVQDGRSHLATAARFPQADLVTTTTLDAPPFAETLRPTDAVAILSHSLEQDRRALAFALEHPLAYLGVLGPATRTMDMLRGLASARSMNTRAADSRATDSREQKTIVAGWQQRVHAPMGLDLGATNPAAIALEILAEIQQTLSGSSAAHLRQIRASSLRAASLESA